LGDDDPLTAGRAFSGGDREHDSFVRDVVCSEDGSGTLGGGCLFCDEPCRSNREGCERSLVGGQIGRLPVGVDERIAA
jgi:hypothetical protein